MNTIRVFTALAACGATVACLDFSLLDPLPVDAGEPAPPPPLPACDPWGTRLVLDWAVVDEPGADAQGPAGLGRRGTQLVVGRSDGALRATCLDGGVLETQASASCPLAPVGRSESTDTGVVVAGAVGGVCVATLAEDAADASCACFEPSVPTSAVLRIALVSAQSFVVLEPAGAGVDVVERGLDGAERLRIAGVPLPADSGIAVLRVDEAAGRWAVALLAPDGGPSSQILGAIVVTSQGSVARVEFPAELSGVAWHATARALSEAQGTAPLVGWSHFPATPAGHVGAPPRHAFVTATLGEDGVVAAFAATPVFDGDPFDRSIAGAVDDAGGVIVGTDGLAIALEGVVVGHLPSVVRAGGPLMRQGDVSDVQGVLGTGQGMILRLGFVAPVEVSSVVPFDQGAFGVLAPVVVDGASSLLLLPRATIGSARLVNNSGVTTLVDVQNLLAVQRAALRQNVLVTVQGPVASIKRTVVSNVAGTLSLATPTTFGPAGPGVLGSAFTAGSGAGPPLLWVLQEGAGKRVVLTACDGVTEVCTDEHTFCPDGTPGDCAKAPFLGPVTMTVIGPDPGDTIVVAASDRVFVIDRISTVVPVAYVVKGPYVLPGPALEFTSPPPASRPHVSLVGGCAVVADAANGRLLSLRADGVDLEVKQTDTASPITAVAPLFADPTAGFAFGKAGRLSEVTTQVSCELTLTARTPIIADVDVTAVVRPDGGQALIAADASGRIWQLGTSTP